MATGHQETLGAGTVPCAISLAAEHWGAQDVEAVVALVRHSGAEAEPVWAAGVDLTNTVFLVSRICTVDDSAGGQHVTPLPAGQALGPSSPFSHIPRVANKLDHIIEVKLVALSEAVDRVAWVSTGN